MKKIAYLLIIITFLFNTFLGDNVQATEVNLKTHPGVFENSMKWYPYKSFKPTTTQAYNDRDQGFIDGCHAGNEKTITKKVCKYGKVKGFKYTLAIIGDSHSAHWLAAVKKYAEKNEVRIVYATKSGCLLTTSKVENYPSCNVWNKQIVKVIAKYKPEVVLSKANTTLKGYNQDPGIYEKFKEITDNGMKVFAIRDTPYFRVNVPECLKKYGRKSIQCAIPKSHIPQKAAWINRLKLQPDVKFVDYTNLICNKGKYCYPVQGNVILVRDSHHLTNTYSSTFANYIFRDVFPYLKEAKAEKIAKKKAERLDQ
ncbi:SGNH hydrolase domain-containing protein [Macrococcus equi]|uniref:SGNH hydrolase domain-containing protein n=1 Tax=Macrococcus equi TaxID=3395462 RepID=UPI0039BEC522